MKRLLFVLFIVFAGPAGPAFADGAPVRQSADDVWGGGPLLALPAVTLPAGTVAVGAALLDQIAHMDSGKGANLVPASDLNAANFRTAFLYGVSDNLNLGLWPTVGLGATPPGRAAANIALGDWMVEGQYRLHQSGVGDWLPTISLNLAETFPTGRYDHLDAASDPLGAGAYTTTVGLYAQTLFWMPTGRILRTEFNLSYALSGAMDVHGMSVYGTTNGFLGHAIPGSSLLGDLTLEYSLAQRWSAASEIQLELDNPTHVIGLDGTGVPSRATSGLGHVLYVIPYLEYAWSPAEGVSFGTRIYTNGHNETPTVMPVILFTRYIGAI